MEPLDNALELLRQEWRSGGRDRRLIPQARRAVELLQAHAVTEQASAELKSLAGRLDRFRLLPEDQHREELTQIANGLKALRPLLIAPDAPAPEMGKMSAAVAPGRAKVAEKPSRPAASLRVLALSPEAPVTDLPKVGPKIAKTLEGHKAKIQKVGDLLDLAPSRYIDYSQTVPITVRFSGVVRVGCHRAGRDYRDQGDPG